MSVTAKDGLHGFDEAAAAIGSLDDKEAGLVLISQMLRLFTNLLGEAATLRLLEDTSRQLMVEKGAGEIAVIPCGTGPNYLGPFMSISSEAEQLRYISERLESLADAHDDLDEHVGVAGNIRNIATAGDFYYDSQQDGLLGGLCLSSADEWLPQLIRSSWARAGSTQGFLLNSRWGAFA